MLVVPCRGGVNKVFLVPLRVFSPKKSTAGGFAASFNLGH